MLCVLLRVTELEGYRQVLRKRGMGTSGAWVGAPANLDSVLRVPAKKQEGGWRFQGTEIPIPLRLSEDRDHRRHLASPFGCSSCGGTRASVSRDGGVVEQLRSVKREGAVFVVRTVFLSWCK